MNKTMPHHQFQLTTSKDFGSRTKPTSMLIHDVQEKKANKRRDVSRSKSTEPAPQLRSNSNDQLESAFRGTRKIRKSRRYELSRSKSVDAADFPPRCPTRRLLDESMEQLKTSTENTAPPPRASIAVIYYSAYDAKNDDDDDDASHSDISDQDSINESDDDDDVEQRFRNSSSENDSLPPKLPPKLFRRSTSHMDDDTSEEEMEEDVDFFASLSASISSQRQEANNGIVSSKHISAPPSACYRTLDILNKTFEQCNTDVFWMSTSSLP